MAEWRARGYVPDSDEEEDSQVPNNAGVRVGHDGFHNVDELDKWNIKQPTECPVSSEDGVQEELVGGGVEAEAHDAILVDEEEQGGQISKDGADIGDQYGEGIPPATAEFRELDEIDELQQDHYESAATQFGAQILQGFNSRMDNLRQSVPSPTSNGLSESRSSSPLSELSTSPPSVLLPMVQVIIPQRHRSHSLDELPTIVSNDQDLPLFQNPYGLLATQHQDQPVEPLPAARTLRHRNPIQLHPYAIESENYRQILKARGVKPLRIAQMQANLASAEARDSQDVEFDTKQDSQLIDNGIDSHYVLSSPPSPDHEVPEIPDQHQADLFHFEGDDLPDVDSLLRQPIPHVVAQRYKRRKIAHTFSKKHGKRHVQPQASQPYSAPGMDDSFMFDANPSPPRSISPAPSDTHRSVQNVFRVPRILSPVALPTPITSSEPRRRPDLEFLGDAVSSDEEAVRRLNGDSTKAAESNGTSSESEETTQLQRVQRKIRGVLPASWLKLDLKTQVKRPDNVVRIRRSLSPSKSPQRGVARPLTGLGSRNHTTPIGQRFPIELSDGDESNPDLGSPTKSSPSNARSINTSVLRNREASKDQRSWNVDWGEVAEDNRVDAMLPPAIRHVANCHPRKKKTKHQTKLAGPKPPRPRTVDHNSLQRSRSNHPNQPKITDRLDRDFKSLPKFRPPRLSILDAPPANDPSRGAKPQFLKVATRAARSRDDKGRHSPSRKFLRLATAEDTIDTAETLRDWREGTIPHAPMTAVASISAHAFDRQPLHSRSGNAQFPREHSNHSNVGGKDAFTLSSATSLKLTSQLSRSCKLQSSLDIITRPRKVRRGLPGSQRQTVRPSKYAKKYKRGQMLSALHGTDHSRPALLESLQEEHDRIHRQGAFQRDLSNVDRSDNQLGIPNVTLARFVGTDLRSPPDAARNVVDLGQTRDRCPPENGQNAKSLLCGRRKRRPRRMDLSDARFKQPTPPTPIDDEAYSMTTAIDETQSRQVLVGLGPFGTQYTNTFEIKPLPTGTYFNEKTLVGSGEFLRSINIRNCEMDKPRGLTPLNFENGILYWGSWNDEVSAQLGVVFGTICQELRIGPGQHSNGSRIIALDHATMLLRSIIRYFSDHLSFSDPIDRNSYLQRCKPLLITALQEVGNCHSTTESHWDSQPSERQKNSQILLQTLLLVIANQICQVSEHDLVPHALMAEIRLLVQVTGQRTLAFTVKDGIHDFQRCLKNLRNIEMCDHGIGEGHSSIEAFVVCQHILGAGDISYLTLRNTINVEVLRVTPIVADARILEVQWQRLFTLLPFLEFDIQGVIETGQRHKVAHDNWLPIKQILSRVFELYILNPGGQSPTFNTYCRALFSRCLHLINTWGWQRCESIIGTLFDFFARNNLAHLRNERSHGSPVFLEHLDQNPSLEPSPNDPCFHVLLKIIGSGLKGMRRLYPDKKIRDIVWRLMPNHGRLHPKEEAIHQEDLDALRNHHDLLCTLYWASPPGFRPRISVIRNLVHLESSHREACHISIRAWTDLIRFQLSTDEPISSIEPFADWHGDLLAQILRQHRLARTEAEEEVESVEFVCGNRISKDILESTIAKNQRQVEAILGHALVSLKLAIDRAQGQEIANILLTIALVPVFELFNAQRPQSNRAIIQALDVLQAYVDHPTSDSREARHRENNDDSQDYGDWAGFDDENASVLNASVDASLQVAAAHLEENFHDPLRQLVSNCFGADAIPEDNLLLRTVEVWVAVIRKLVESGRKCWNDYFGQYGHDSWSSLRDTEQTRKFTAYLLALLIETDEDVYQENETYFIQSWVSSLVEREALLKFQHRLTSAILNADGNNALLRNLPFWVNRHAARFDITAQEFRDRRLSLISSVLSNMRESVERAAHSSTTDTTKLRQEYKEILKHLMASMKQKYQELGLGSNVQGAYVDFVHRVVGFLQQHTSAICPVDRFFTDSAAFPLPATDPTYVVGQLKNYGLRLNDKGTPKQLAVFVQSISERAAMDGQQSYLSSQLHAAMSRSAESGNVENPTLTLFLVQALVPAYMQVAFSTTSGWLLVLPILQALQKAFRELLTVLDGTDATSIARVATTISVFLECVRSAFLLLIDHSGLLDLPKVQRTLRACYSAVTALMPTLDYITRLNGAPAQALNSIEFFTLFAAFTSALLLNHPDTDSPEMPAADSTIPAEPSLHTDVRKFALQELRTSLAKTWTCHNERYYIARGNSRREVVTDLASHEEEKRLLLAEFDSFNKCRAMMPALSGEEGGETRLPFGRFGGMGMEDVFSI